MKANKNSINYIIHETAKKQVEYNKNQQYKNYARELRNQKLINIDLRKKMTPAVRSLITRRTNKFEVLVKHDYDFKKITNQRTKNILKKSDEIVIGDYLYTPKKSKVTFKKRGKKVIVTRNYSAKRKTTKIYGQNGLSFKELLEKLQRPLAENQGYIVYIDGIPMRRIFEAEIDYSEKELQSLKDKTQKKTGRNQGGGKFITVGIAKF